MSLKNTYGFSGSLLDAVTNVLKEGSNVVDNDPDKEEVENLDELKTSTIKSYAKKAVSSSMSGQGGEKRVKGISRAMDKLSTRKKEKDEKGRYIPKFDKVANEEVELDEVSAPTGKFKVKINHDQGEHHYNVSVATTKDERTGLRRARKAAKTQHMKKYPNHIINWIENVKEEVELDELSKRTLGSYALKSAEHMADLQNMIGKGIANNKAYDKLSKRNKGFKKAVGKLTKESVKKKYEEVEHIDEKIQDKMYPHQANQAATSMVTLVAMLRYLKATGMLQKLMKEDIDLAGLFFGEEICEEMHAYVEANKGAYLVPSDDPKKSDPDSDEDEDAYKPASGKDQPHVLNQLAGAADVGGRHIDTAKGKRYVSGSTAKKLHGALMKAKPEERAKLSSNLYKNSHSAIEKDHADAVKRGIKPPAEKKGRGRPKKVQ